MIFIRQAGFSRIRRNRELRCKDSRTQWGASLTALLCLPLLVGLASNTSAADLPKIKFSEPVKYVNEGDTVTLKVVKDGAGATDVQYYSKYHSGPGDRATPGEDYTPVSGTLKFADGDTQKSFSVNILSDSDLTEEQEVIDVYLGVDTEEAVLGVPGLTVIVIQ